MPIGTSLSILMCVYKCVYFIRIIIDLTDICCFSLLIFCLCRSNAIGRSIYLFHFHNADNFVIIIYNNRVSVRLIILSERAFTTQIPV